METRLPSWFLALTVGCLLLASSCSNDHATTPVAVASAPLLVTSQSDLTVASYKMDMSTGRLTANGTPLSTGAGSVPNAAIIVGNAAFVANGSSNDIARFSINSDGTLTVQSGNQATGNNPVAMVVDQTGKLLFVANQGDQTVSVFKVSGTSLTLTSTMATAGDPAALVVAPAGNHLYVANSSNGTISGFTFSSSGALTPMAQGPFSSLGSTPSALAITPDGRYLFVANYGSNDVAGFTLCTIVNSICPAADGSLVPYLNAPYLTGVAPRSMVITSAGSSLCDPMIGCTYYLFIANQFSNQVSMFTAVPTVDPLTNLVTDQLKPNNPAIISTGSNPVAIAVPSTGGFAFVANSGSSSVSSFTIRPDGLLLANGAPVPTGGQPSSLGPK